MSVLFEVLSKTHEKKNHGENFLLPANACTNGDCLDCLLFSYRAVNKTIKIKLYVFMKRGQHDHVLDFILKY